MFDRDELFENGSEVVRHHGRVGFTRGLVSCVLNPKVGLFFLLLAPQYAPQLSFMAILGLGLIDAAVAFAYLTVLAVTAAAIFTRIVNQRTQRRLRLGSGAAIALVGTYILFDALI